MWLLSSRMEPVRRTFANEIHTLTIKHNQYGIMTRKPPQERKTPISLNNTTRIQSDRELLRIDTKYFKGSYNVFLVINTVEGVETFRDAVQYALASLVEDEPMPDQYENTKPLTDRQRRFSVNHESFTVSNGYPVSPLYIEHTSTPDYILEIRTKEDDTAPLWINTVDDLIELKDICDALIEHEQDTN